MKFLLKVLNTVFILVLICYTVILLTDIFGVIAEPENYRIAQGFTEKQLSLKSSDVQEYLFKEIGLLMAMVLITFLTILNLRKKLNKVWTYIYYVSFALLISFVVSGYYNWLKTGFDH